MLSKSTLCRSFAAVTVLTLGAAGCTSSVPQTQSKTNNVLSSNTQSSSSPETAASLAAYDPPSSYVLGCQSGSCSNSVVFKAAVESLDVHFASYDAHVAFAANMYTYKPAVSMINSNSFLVSDGHTAATYTYKTLANELEINPVATYQNVGLAKESTLIATSPLNSNVRINGLVDLNVLTGSTATVTTPGL